MAFGQYRFFLLMSAALLLLTEVFADGESNGPIGNGEWTPIKNVINPHVHELGEFAVRVYNYRARKSLKFHGVVSWVLRVTGASGHQPNSKVLQNKENTDGGIPVGSPMPKLDREKIESDNVRLFFSKVFFHTFCCHAFLIYEGGG